MHAARDTTTSFGKGNHLRGVAGRYLAGDAVPSCLAKLVFSDGSASEVSRTPSLLPLARPAILRGGPRAAVNHIVRDFVDELVAPW